MLDSSNFIDPENFFTQIIRPWRNDKIYLITTLFVYLGTVLQYSDTWKTSSKLNMHIFLRGINILLVRRIWRRSKTMEVQGLVISLGTFLILNGITIRLQYRFNFVFLWSISLNWFYWLCYLTTIAPILIFGATFPSSVIPIEPWFFAGEHATNAHVSSYWEPV